MKRNKNKEELKAIHKMIGRLECRPERVVPPRKKYDRKRSKREWRRELTA